MAGADVFRLNFSHGTHEEHTLRYNAIREIDREPILTIIGTLRPPKCTFIRTQEEKLITPLFSYQLIYSYMIVNLLIDP